LKELWITSQRLRDLAPLGALSNLSELSVGQNCVADLAPLTRLAKLKNLSVPFNYVTDLTPLAGMTQLEHVGLSGNYFKSLAPLAGLYELHSLWLDSTGQKDLSALTALKRFNLLNVERNPIDCDAQAKNLAILDESAKLNGGTLHHDCTEIERRARARGLRDEFSTPVVRNKSTDARCKAEPFFPKRGSLERVGGPSRGD
jgi:Leucine-rich repeat (LRR) protein